MAPFACGEVTSTLHKLTEGDTSAADRLFAMVYDEFRALANNYLLREPPDHSLQPTELVHEAYLKLVDQTRVDWKGRSHFFAVGAMSMRRILVNHAKAKKREKRGGGAEKIVLEESMALSREREEDVLAIDQALGALEKLNERQAKIVELRFFRGSERHRGCRGAWCLRKYRKGRMAPMPRLAAPPFGGLALTASRASRERGFPGVRWF